MPKFYFTTLARRPLTYSGKVFTFMICSVSGGSAIGIYEATAPDEIAILDDAVRSRRGVREIGSDQFEDLKKKANPTQLRANSNGSKPRVIQPPILPQIAVEEKAGVPSAGKPKPASAEDNLFTGPSATRPSIGTLLRTSKMGAPKPFGISDAKTKKASGRADRAKIRVARPSDAG